MIVLKFGGTSAGTAGRMKKIMDIIKDKKDIIVVLSAMSGTTNALVQISEALYRQEKDVASGLINKLESNYKRVVSDLDFPGDLHNEAADLVQSHFDFLRTFTLDMFTILEEKEVLAQGELLSTALFQLLCRQQGLNSVLLPALNFMRIDEDSEPDQDYISHNLTSELSLHQNADIFITQGYICRNAFGEIDNLKRGGGDYSATLIGTATDATEIQIWTDIDGMRNNDPRFVDETFAIDELSYDEAAELAYFGAKILHPTCILPARIKNIPVRLLNSLNSTAKGTVITASVPTSPAIRAIAAKDGITVINIHSDRMLLAFGFLRAVFEVFERYRTPIDMITTSEVAVSLTIDDKISLEKIVNELKEFGKVDVEEGMSIVCIVGSLTPDIKGIASKIFDSLRDIPVRMISYGGSRNNISILVKTEFKTLALNYLNKGLF